MAFIVYTGLRLLLLVVATGLFYLVGMRGLLVLVMGFLASGLLSWFLLDKQRASFGSQVQGWFGRMNDRIDEASRKEDYDYADDEAEAQNETATPAATGTVTDTNAGVVDVRDGANEGEDAPVQQSPTEIREPHSAAEDAGRSA